MRNFSIMRLTTLRRPRLIRYVGRDGPDESPPLGLVLSARRHSCARRRNTIPAVGMNKAYDTGFVFSSAHVLRDTDTPQLLLGVPNRISELLIHQHRQRFNNFPSAVRRFLSAAMPPIEALFRPMHMGCDILPIGF